MMLGIIVALGFFGVYCFLRCMGGMGFAILACVAIGYVVYCYQDTSRIMAEQKEAQQIASEQVMKRPKPTCDPGWEYHELALKAGVCEYTQDDGVKRSIRQN